MSTGRKVRVRDKRKDKKAAGANPKVGGPRATKRDKSTGQYIKAVERKIDASKPNQVIVGNMGPQTKDDPNLPKTVIGDNQTNEQYPNAFLSAEDERDLMMQTRLALKNQLGQQYFTEKDADWLLKKIRAAKDADFQAWFARKYDTSSLTAKAWAREVFPEFYRQRLKTLDINLDTLRKLARIRIRGVETPEDVALQYAADNGLLPLEQLASILHPLADNTRQAQKFQRGLFNINTYFDGTPNDATDKGNSVEAYYNNSTIPVPGRFSDIGNANAPRSVAQRAISLI